MRLLTRPRNKVSAYIQKPFDGEELLMVIQRLTAAEALFKLQEEYFTVFKI